MDTLFQFVDAHLYAHLIEMKDSGKGGEFMDFKTYEEIYRHVRECIDLCHRDGVIKDEVARNPSKYIVQDPNFIPMIKQFKESGKKVFILTNSYWEYTSTAMNYLYHNEKVSPEEQMKNEWMDLFDLVIVGSCKPAFLLDPYLNLFRVNPLDGSLKNTDGLYDIDALGDNGAQKFLQQGKVFQGGNWNHLHALLKINAGEEILYVGDHMYGDVIRSKRALGWRTGLIVPELEWEMQVFAKQNHLANQIIELRKLRDEMGAYSDELRLTMLHSSQHDNEETNQIISDLEHDDKILKKKLTEMADTFHRSFHPVWGQIFYSGYQDSRFAFYVQNYACIYMSKATNLFHLSMNRALRTAAEMLPHDKLLADESSTFDNKL